LYKFFKYFPINICFDFVYVSNEKIGAGFYLNGGKDYEKM